uniref:Uncharacterized protein n=1 Tax=Avena sativa TaxID=4498 RepID=A0ACD5ZN12_AVESA
MPCTSSKVAPRTSSNARPMHGHSLPLLFFLRSLPAQLVSTTSSSSSSARRKKVMAVTPRGRPGTSIGHRRPTLLLLLLCCLLLALFPCRASAFHSFVGTYGVNYGQIADNLPTPPEVVRLLQMAKIKNVRIFDSNPKVLDAFRNSGLNLAIAIPNGLVKDISANPAKAMDWVNENVQPYYPSTHISAIIVGNEILGGADSGLAEALIGAVVNVHDALRALRLSRTIEVNTPHSEAVFGSSYPPSNGTFRPDLMVYLKPLLDFFSKTGAPFYVNAYPFLAYMSDPEHIDVKYALMEPNAGILDPKTNLHYDNMFEAQLDATYSALELAGYPDMEVRVSETGWASEGDASETAATLENARTYNFNLRKRLFLRKGTPYRPKRVVKAFIFALFNEDQKTGPGSERHFGLFKPDGSVSLDLGFKGLTSDSSPSLHRDQAAKGWIFSAAALLSSCSTFLFLALAA